MMSKFCFQLSCLQLVTSLALIFTISLAYEFPKPQNADIIAFLDEEYGLKDLAGSNNLRDTSWYATVRTDIKGPFGEINSCWGVTQELLYMCKYHRQPVSRTIVFYFHTPATAQLGPIIYLPNCFNVNYNKQDLVFKGLNPIGLAVEKERVVKDFLIPNSWNFIAFTDDGINLRLYNEEGTVLETLPSFAEYQNTYFWFSIGEYFDSSSAWNYMKKTDAFSCLYVYNATLSGEEISQIPSSCKFKGNPTTTSTTSTSTTTTTIPSQDETVCPQNEHLIGLWPLSSTYGSSDVSGNDLEPAHPAEVNEFTIGPHGNADIAVITTKADSSILKIESDKLAPPQGSFTVAMWFSPQGGEQSGGLFEFLDELGTSKAFQFHYSGADIEISANSMVIGRFSMVQPSRTWTFIAVTLENYENLTVYGDHGMVGQLQKCLPCSNAAQFNTGGMALGHSTLWGDYIQVGDAVSCLAVYHAVLTDLELCQLKDCCRIFNSVALSGQPQIPLGPIPDLNPPISPKIPKYGQFPWIGSLQFFGKHICSATIINSFWVLTSATCVVEDHSPTYYKFIAAIHDIEISYEQQQEMEITKISVSGDQMRDLALLQLAEPLGMTSDYINDAYIARGGEMYANWLKEQIFVGWGINGRSELDSPTLPRYVSGTTLSDSQCEILWPQEFNSTYDYCFRSFIEDQDVPCHEDEGSPLLVQTDGNVDAGMGERLLQVGVYRRRDENCSKLKPGLFTRTAPFAEWISNVIDRV